MSENVKELTKVELEEILKSDLPVMVDFWADWCGPCKTISPVIEQLADAGKGHILVGKVNIDKEVEAAAWYGIMSIPTVIVFKNGDVVGSLVGAHAPQEYVELLKKAL